MKAIKNEFPNPVLAAGRDDYIEGCYFYTTFKEDSISVGKENIIIPMEYVLKCDGLQKLVANGDAAVVIVVKSSAASYSRLFQFPVDTTELTINIPKFEVVNRMEITGSVIAAHNIDQFCCQGEFNDMYFGASTFEIRKGDILATEDTRIIYVDDSELEKPISSIFDITERDDIRADIEPYFEEQKIIIYLKKDLYELYYKFKDFNNGALRRYSAGIIVYPVLIEAIAYIIGHYQALEKDEGEMANYSEKRWFRAIEKKSIDLGIDLSQYDDSYTMLADRLLGGISLDALQRFKDTFEREMDNGETQIIGGQD